MKQEGFILMITLIFLALLAMLSVSILSHAQLQVRAVNHMALTAAAFCAVEAALAAAEHRLYALPDNALPTSRQVKPWQSLVYTTIRYNQWDVHYIIDKLPGITCLRLANQQTQQGAFYRVTAWLGLPQQTSLILQSSDARPTGQPCLPKQHAMRAGRLSWRAWYF